MASQGGPSLRKPRPGSNPPLEPTLSQHLFDIEHHEYGPLPTLLETLPAFFLSPCLPQGANFLPRNSAFYTNMDPNLAPLQ